MTDEVRTEVEQIKLQENVKEALKQTAGAKDDAMPVAETKDKLWLGTHLVLLLGLGALYYALSLRILGFASRIIPLLQKLTLSAMAVILVLAIAKIVQVYLIGRVGSTASRYNLKRILRLAIGLLMALIVISIFFQDWYTTVVSVGLISLILGFALQTPITSFIGWIYILAKSPYRVGDRIKIGEATGDVIDVSYIDTTLWEFGGDYLSTDHPTGRVIKFPNSKVLNTEIYNYTWALFPYVWNEIKFNIAYQSDLEFVSQTMQEVAEKELGEAMMERVKVFREILAQTPVDELEVQERPVVLFRVNSNTWLDAIVRYVVHPKQAGRVKSRMIKELLQKLNAAPDRVLFPKGNMR
ncbi:MAG: hypothetical protein QOD75_2074 [Blastocatellia bacterium]|jgi:small-conductance mechanosensitive channel|nr:hypothetical protein [Blastocatellia bacterium]